MDLGKVLLFFRKIPENLNYNLRLEHDNKPCPECTYDAEQGLYLCSDMNMNKNKISAWLKTLQDGDVYGLVERDLHVEIPCVEIKSKVNQ